MAEFVSITKRIRRDFHLFPGEEFTIRFTPKEGDVAVTATISGPANNFEPIDDAEPPQPGTPFVVSMGLVKITILSPTGMVKEQLGTIVNTTQDLSEFSVRAVVPPEQAEQEWRCSFMLTPGLRVTEANCRGTVIFDDKWHQLITTLVPMRVLNHAARPLLDALGLIIHLDGQNSFIDFSEELKAFSDGRLKQIPLDLPGQIRDINLKTFSIETRRGNHPVIELDLQFETEGEEFSLGTFLGANLLDLDLTTAAVQIRLELIVPSGPTGSRSILPRVTIDFNFEGSISGLLASGIVSSAIDRLKGIDPSDLDGISSITESILNEKIKNLDVLAFIGDYLTKGLVQLSSRFHAFHDVKVDDQHFLVKHFDARVEMLPSKHEDPVPLILPEVIPLIGEQLEEPVNLEKIEHIVVLMQENRSFDHMLGYLSLLGGREDVDGLKGGETNPLAGLPPVGVTRLLPEDTAMAFSPAHDIGEVTKQIANGKMTGFVESFVSRFPGADPRLVMGFFDREQVPTFDFLAKHYLVCDRWFCSFPGHTQPNRFLTLGGEIASLVNFDFDDPQIGYLKLPRGTLFDLLDLFRGGPWVYYEQDVSFLRFYNNFRLNNREIIPLDDPENLNNPEGFFFRARNGTLPKVTFIDPNFVDIPPIRSANDDHAPADIALGQDMIARIYDALVTSPQWPKTMFVITYDEHGGFFDHVPPPGTPEAEDQERQPEIHPDGPVFLGPRVPAFVISPWVGKGKASHVVFDHASIMKTIVLKFLGPEFLKLTSQRVRKATQLGVLLDEPSPRTDTPTLNALAKPPPRARKIDPAARPKPERDDFHEATKRFGRPLKL